MEYRCTDIKKIAAFIAESSTSDLPECACIKEDDAYWFCTEYNIDTDLLDNNVFSADILAKFLCELAKNDRLTDFLFFYFNTIIEEHNTLIAQQGYNIFSIKDKIITYINTIWSIPYREFSISYSKCELVYTEYTLHNKMGEGAFCIVYKCEEDKSKVYKVLNRKERGNKKSVHRFKREYEIMEKHNRSGYTISVSCFDESKLVYAMERAKYSLEDYIESYSPSENERDELVLRVANCMAYLHDCNIVHRDFHPGNILYTYNNAWVVTDFGLAKDMTAFYSKQTTNTNNVGRAWFTDPLQLVALKDGNKITDMYSLAKTVEYIMNGDYSGRSNKFSAVVYKATASNPIDRYEDIKSLIVDIEAVISREKYESSNEIIHKLKKKYKDYKQIDVIEMIELLNDNMGENLMLDMVIDFGIDIAKPYCNIADIRFDVALREINNVYEGLNAKYWPWHYYDVVAQWANKVIIQRNKNDDICITAAKIIKYVAGNINRFDIQHLSNQLKNNSKIDGHIRAELSYY